MKPKYSPKKTITEMHDKRSYSNRKMAKNLLIDKTDGKLAIHGNQQSTKRQKEKKFQYKRSNQLKKTQYYKITTVDAEKAERYELNVNEIPKQ